MKTVKYNFYLSQAGQKAQILAGLNAEQKQSIEIPATPEALQIASIDSDGNAEIKVTKTYDAIPTAEMVQAEIVENLAAAAKKLADALTSIDADMLDPDRRAKIIEALAKKESIEYRVSWAGHDAANRWTELNRAELEPEIQAMRDRLAVQKIEAETQRAEAEKQREIRNAEAASKKQVGIDALMAWADTHGSERLAAMRKLSVGDVVTVAEEEFFTAHTPVGYTAEAYQRSNDCDARRKPTLEELEEFSSLSEAVKSSAGILADPRLQYHTVEAREDVGEWVEASHYAATDVDVIAPTGKTLTVAKVITDDL